MNRQMALLAIALIACIQSAFAANDPIGMNRELLLDFSSKSQASESMLRSKDAVDWTQSEIDEYLYSSLLAIYYSTNIFILQNDRHPSSSEELTESGILEYWPLNPFNEWKPITWKPDSIEFSAGNIAVQLCPPDWYSRPNPPRPITYAISIFGPTPEYTPLHEKETSPFDTLTWAIEPEGAAFSTGFFKGAAK